jgi:microcystin-dependent protein
MPISQYLPFATGGGANTLTYAAYNVHALRTVGHQPGIALSEVENTVLRQCSVAAAGVAAFSTTYGALNCLDDGSTENYKLALKSAIDALIAASQFVATGAVMAFARTSAPTGWLKCNGVAVSRTTYAVLFGIIGVTYGPGNGSTTFNLPDFRGEFIRGLDDGRGIDPGRGLEDFQADQVEAHKHMTQWGESSGGTTFGRSTTGGKFGTEGNDSDNYWFHTNDGSDYDGTVNPAGLIGDETRPRNRALLYCIKF